MSGLPPNRMIGSYQVIHQIGQGGMATVYKAYHPAMDRYVAIKLLPHQFAKTEEFLRRFQKEVRVIARLEHPHILPVYDSGESDGIPYLVMRLLETGTLSERMAQGPLSAEEIDHIFTQLTSALGYAHAQGVVHRDIKPSNVMLDARGDVFLTDFGIARLLEGTTELTATGAVTGTPAYMSPEQAQGERVDQRSDIYSLGIMLYEMLTGRVPFEAETPLAVLLKKIQEAAPPPRKINPNLSPLLEPVLLKALARVPGDRFPSVEAFLASWKNALAEISRTKGNVTTLPMPASEDGASDMLREQKGDSSLPATDPDLEKRLAQLYDSGLSAYWLEDWEKARQYLEELVRLRADYPGAAAKLAATRREIDLGKQYLQAQDSIQAGDWTTALAALEPLSKAAPGYRDVSNLLEVARQQAQLAELNREAERLSQAGQWQAVINIFQRIRSVVPDYPDTKGWLAAAEKGLEEEALQRRLAEMYRAALQAMEAGSWLEARDLLGGIGALSQGYRDSNRLLERVSVEINRSEAARKEAEIVSWYEEARAALAGKDWERAVEKCQAILDFEPGHSGAMEILQEVQQGQTLIGETRQFPVSQVGEEETLISPREEKTAGKGYSLSEAVRELLKPRLFLGIGLILAVGGLIYLLMAWILSPRAVLGGGALVFVSDRDGKREIYRLDKSGDVVRLTYTPGKAESWDPQLWGNSLYFTSNRDGKREIFRLDGNGNVERITSTQGKAESWHPAVLRNMLYFTSNRDGKREIYRIDTSGTVLRVTSTTGRAESWEPAAGAGAIYFTSDRDGKREIYRVGAGGEVDRMTSTPGDAESWSPVSGVGTLFFTSNRTGKQEIFRVDKKGGVVQMTDTGGEAESWHPEADGENLYFTSNRDGKREIYRIEPSGKIVRMTYTAAGGESWGGE